VPDYDPYVDLDVGAAGTYTLTWDGSNPGYPTWEGEWGTWSFDVDLYRLDDTATWAIDHFYAKTHDGWSENYDVLVDPVNHHVWWHCDETTTPPGYQFRCNFIVHSDESTPPTAVDLVTLKELTVKATRTGPVTLNTLHDNLITYPGSGYTTETDTLGTWRTVFTGQTASGAEHRRDGTNPRILATNAFTWVFPLIVWLDPGLPVPDGAWETHIRNVILSAGIPVERAYAENPAGAPWWRVNVRVADDRPLEVVMFGVHEGIPGNLANYVSLLLAQMEFDGEPEPPKTNHVQRTVAFTALHEMCHQWFADLPDGTPMVDVMAPRFSYAKQRVVIDGEAIPLSPAEAAFMRSHPHR